MPEQKSDASDLHWFAVQTRHRHEKRVAERLQLSDVESFLPVHCAMHRWNNGQRVKVKSPLFPCYLFARIRSAQRLDVVRDPGVISLAASNASPTPIPDDEIAQLRRVADSVMVEPHPYLALGERVRIVAGPLVGMEGVLTRKKQELRVVISVEVIMRSVAIEISEFDIEPARDHLRLRVGA